MRRMTIEETKMSIIRFNRKKHILYIGDSNNRTNITILYVSHVVNRSGGWYDIYNGDMLLGFVTNVEKVEEQW